MPRSAWPRPTWRRRAPPPDPLESPRAAAGSTGEGEPTEASDAAHGDGAFLRSARTVSALTLVSRILGYVRDAVTVRLLGGSLVGDALIFAWTVPNAFRRLFGEGALSAAFMPEFARVLEQQGRSRARAMANVVISTAGAMLVLLAALLVVALAVVPDDWAVDALHMDLAKVALVRRYLAWLLPYLAVICVVAQFMGVLNTLGEFTVPASSPIILNVIWIAAALVAGRIGPADPADSGFVIVVAILGSAVLQFAWHLPRMRALGVGFAPARPRVTPELRAVAARMGPLLLAMGAGQVNIITDRVVALTALGDGGVVHLYLGMRLMQFPLGVVSIALSAAVFPVLNRLVARDDLDAAADTTRRALRANVLLSLPAAVGLALLATGMVTLLFEGGAFGAPGAALASDALRGYAFAVPCLGVIMVLNRVCFALGEVRLPMRVAALGVVVNVVLDLALVGPFGEFGLAAATTATALLHALTLHLLVRARLGLRTGRSLFGPLGRVLLPSALMALVVVAAARLLPDVLVGDAVSKSRLGAALAVQTVLGLVSYAAFTRVLCPADWRALSALWRRGGPSAG